MAITPYEALAMVPKSQEASLFRTSQMQKENAQQAQIAGQVQQQTEQKMNRTENPSGFLFCHTKYTPMCYTRVERSGWYGTEDPHRRR